MSELADVEVKVSLGLELIGFELTCVKITPADVIEYLRHTFDVELEYVHCTDPHVWVFRFAKGSSRRVPLSGFVMCEFETGKEICFNLRLFDQANEINSVPESFEDTVLISLDGQPTNLLVGLELGFLTFGPKETSKRSMADISECVTEGTLQLYCSRTRFLSWRVNPQQASAWCKALEAHRTFATKFRRDAISDQILIQRGFAGGINILIYRLEVIPIAGGPHVDLSQLKLKLKFGDNQKFSLKTISSVNVDHVDYQFNPPKHCFRALPTQVGTTDLRCIVGRPIWKLGFISQYQETEVALKPVGLFTSEDFERHTFSFDLSHEGRSWLQVKVVLAREGAIELGSVNTNQFTSISNSSDDFRHFRIVRLVADRLPNVEIGLDANDPYVTVLYCGQEQQTSIQMEAGAHAEWDDDNSQDLRNIVGICIKVPVSHFSSASAPSNIKFAVTDWNQRRKHELIGEIETVIPPELASLQQGETYEHSYNLMHPGLGAAEFRGNLRVVFRRDDESLTSASSLSAKDNVVSSRLSYLRKKTATITGPGQRLKQLLGPPDVQQGLVPEVLAVTCSNDALIETDTMFHERFLSSLLVELRHLSAGKLQLSPQSVIQHSLRPWSCELLVPDARYLGPLSALLEPGAVEVVCVRGIHCSVKRKELSPMMRSDSMQEALQNALVVPELPYCAERAAVLLHRSVCLMCPATRREPLNRETVTEILVHLNTQCNSSQQTPHLTSAISRLVSLGQAADTPAQVRELATLLLSALDDDGEMAKFIPEWLRNITVNGVVNDRLSVSADIDARIDELLMLFEKFRISDKSIGNELLLLYFHFTILLLVRAQGNPNEIVANYKELRRLLDANSDIYSGYHSCSYLMESAQIIIARFPLDNYLPLKVVTGQILERVRPLDISSLSSSLSFSRTDKGAIACNSVAIRMVSSRPPRGPSHTDELPILNSTHKDQNICFKLLVFDDDDFPALPSSFRTKERLGESCFALKFENDENRKHYMEYLMSQRQALGFSCRVQSVDTGMIVELASARLLSYLKMQVALTCRILAKVFEQLVTKGDGWNNDDIDLIKYLLHSLKLVKNLDIFGADMAGFDEVITAYEAQKSEIFAKEASLQLQISSFCKTFSDINSESALKPSQLLHWLCNLDAFEHMWDFIDTEREKPLPLSTALDCLISLQSDLSLLAQNCDTSEQLCGYLSRMIQLVELFQSDPDDAIGFVGREASNLVSRQYSGLFNSLKEWSVRLRCGLDNCRNTVCVELFDGAYSRMATNPDPVDCLINRQDIYIFLNFWQRHDAAYSVKLEELCRKYDAALLATIVGIATSVLNKCAKRDWRLNNGGSVCIEQECGCLEVFFELFCNNLHRLNLADVDPNHSVDGILNSIQLELTKKSKVSANAIASVSVDAKKLNITSITRDVEIVDRLNGLLRVNGLSGELRAAIKPNYDSCMLHLRVLVNSWSDAFLKLRSTLLLPDCAAECVEELVLIYDRVLAVSNSVTSDLGIKSSPQILSSDLITFCKAAEQLAIDVQSIPNLEILTVWSDLDLSNTLRHISSAREVCRQFTAVGELMDGLRTTTSRVNGYFHRLLGSFIKDIDSRNVLASNFLTALPFSCIRQLGLLVHLIRFEWVEIVDTLPGQVSLVVEAITKFGKYYNEYFQWLSNELHLGFVVNNTSVGVNESGRRKIIMALKSILKMSADYEKIQKICGSFKPAVSNEFNVFVEEAFNSQPNECLEKGWKMYCAVARRLFTVGDGDRIANLLLSLVGTVSESSSLLAKILPDSKLVADHSEILLEASVTELSVAIDHLQLLLDIGKAFGPQYFDLPFEEILMQAIQNGRKRASERGMQMVNEVDLLIGAGDDEPLVKFLHSKITNLSLEPAVITQVYPDMTVDISIKDGLKLCSGVKAALVTDILVNSSEIPLQALMAVNASPFCDVISRVRAHSIERNTNIEQIFLSLDLNKDCFIDELQEGIDNAYALARFHQRCANVLGQQLSELNSRMTQLSFEVADRSVTNIIERINRNIDRGSLLVARTYIERFDIFWTRNSVYFSGAANVNDSASRFKLVKQQLQEKASAVASVVLRAIDFLHANSELLAADIEQTATRVFRDCGRTEFFAIANVGLVDSFYDSFQRSFIKLVDELNRRIDASTNGSDLPQIKLCCDSLQVLVGCGHFSSLFSNFLSKLEQCNSNRTQKQQFIDKLKSTLWAWLCGIEADLAVPGKFRVAFQNLYENWPKWEALLVLPTEPNTVDYETNRKAVRMFDVLVPSIVSMVDNVTKVTSGVQACLNALSVHQQDLISLIRLESSEQRTLKQFIDQSLTKFDSGSLSSLLKSVIDAFVTAVNALHVEFMETLDSLADITAVSDEQIRYKSGVLRTLMICDQSALSLAGILAGCSPSIQETMSNQRLQRSTKLVGDLDLWGTCSGFMATEVDLHEITDGVFINYMNIVGNRLTLLIAALSSQTECREVSSALGRVSDKVVSDMRQFIETNRRNILNALRNIEEKQLLKSFQSEKSSFERSCHESYFRVIAKSILYLCTLKSKFDESSQWSLGMQEFIVSGSPTNADILVQLIGFVAVAADSFRSTEQKLQQLLNELEVFIYGEIDSKVDDLDFISITVSKAIVELTFISEEILYHFETQFKSTISNILMYVQRLNRRSYILKAIFDRLISEVDETRIHFAESVACNNPVFAEFESRRQFKKMNTRSAEDLVTNLEFIFLNEAYQATFRENDRKDMYLQYLAEFASGWNETVRRGAKQLCSIVAEARKEIYWAYKSGTDSYVLVRSLLVKIFAVWTLLYSRPSEEGAESFASAEEQAESHFLGKEPHRGQILALIILFDGIVISSAGSSVAVQVPNQFVQIGTGEGKSVTLAVSAIVFALLGMDVDCTCYSQQLCTRDYAGFRTLFDAFGMTSHIRYQTFNNQCKQFVNDKLQHFGGVTGAVNSLFHNDELVPESTSVASPAYMRYLRRRVLKSMLKYARHQLHKSDTKSLDAVSRNLVADCDEFHLGLTANKRNRVLLLDEADMFFSEDFCGARFDIVHLVKHRSIAELLYALWTKQGDYPIGNIQSTFGKVISGPEFTSCANIFKYRGWTEILKQSVLSMIVDRDTVAAGQPEEAVVMPGLKIGHRGTIGGPFVDTVRARYETTFQFLKLIGDTGKLSPSQLLDREDYMSLLVKCGKFSYSEIPKRYLEHGCLVGVSGTVKTMDDVQLKFMSAEYGLVKNTVIPCAFGNKEERIEFCKGVSMTDRRARLVRGLHIVRSDQKMSAITNEILLRLRDDKLDPNNQSIVRAVLIFFTDDKTLQAYINSGEFSRLFANGCLEGDILVLNNDTPDAHRAAQIRKACQPKRITLCSREFGRGEDFIVRIKKLATRGGIHVMQTFVSDELSEEIQIKGRTGRQDNLGSFSLVLSEAEVDVDTLNAISRGTDTSCYAILNTSRNRKFKSICQSRFDKLPDARELDSKSQEFIDDILTGQIDAVGAYLLSTNLASVPSKGNGIDLLGGAESRTCVLIDGTMSMRNMFRAVLSTIETLFQDVRRIITKKNVGCKFFLQFVVYRNYNSGPDKLLKESKWSESHVELLPFLESIVCEGGGENGREAIEAGLQYVNLQVSQGVGISQVIIIGDASYNNDSDIAKYRSQKPNEWSRYPKTTFKSEFSKIVAKSIPVHTFMVLPRATQWTYIPSNKTFIDEFETIANKTKGSPFTLNVNDAGADFNDYMEKFAITILKDIGKSSASSDALIESYKRERSLAHVV